MKINFKPKKRKKTFFKKAQNPRTVIAAAKLTSGYGDAGDVVRIFVDLRK